MKSRFTALILALALTGCASLPARQKAVQSTQAVDFALSTFQDAEWRLCNATAYQSFLTAGRSLTAAVTACAGPEAEAAALTTAKHQAINRQLAEAFGLQKKIVVLLQGWQQGQPPPADLNELMTRSQSFLDMVKTLATTDQQKKLISLGETVLVEVQKIVAAIQGGR
jgi:hypothetical protein